MRRPASWTLVVGIVGVAVSALGALLPGWTDLGLWRWVVLAGAFVSLAALVLQQRGAGAVAVPFTAADWQPLVGPGHASDQKFLRIPYTRHGRRHPTPEVFMTGPDATFELVQCDVHLLGRDVQIVIGVEGFAGEVRIH